MNRDRVQELYRIPKGNGHTVSVCVDRESEIARMSGHPNGEYVVCNDFDPEKKEWHHGNYCYTNTGILTSLVYKLGYEEILKSRTEMETELSYDELLKIAKKAIGCLKEYSDSYEDMCGHDCFGWDLDDISEGLTEKQKEKLGLGKARDMNERLKKLAKYVIEKDDLTEMLKFDALKDMVSEAIDSEDEYELNEADDALKEWEDEYGI